MSTAAPETTTPETESNPGVEPKLVGVIAEFDGIDDIMRASRRLRDAGFRKWDVHSPFPIHGIDAAMGIRRTILPWLVLGAGVFGVCFAIFFQWYLNRGEFSAVSGTIWSGYKYQISGKPYWSLPANVPVAFEVGVLLAAFTALGGMIAMNKLPQYYNAFFKSERFRRVTDDKLIVMIDAADPIFDAERTPALLKELGAVGVEEGYDDPQTAKIPRGLIYGWAIMVIVSFIPAALIFRVRYLPKAEPPYHLVHDLDFQQKFKAQTDNEFFADGRTNRPPVPGAIPFGAAHNDPELTFGVSVAGGVANPNLVADAPAKPNYVTEFPKSITIDEKFYERGRALYKRFCIVCHGTSGEGDGLVVKRAMAVSPDTFQIPTNLHAATVTRQPLGEIFNTITNGKQRMPPYGKQIDDPSDRWAIVLYVKALHKTRSFTEDQVKQIPLGDPLKKKLDAFLKNKK